MFLQWCGDVLPKVYIFVPRLVSGTGRGFGSAPQQKHTRCGQFFLGHGEQMNWDKYLKTDEKETRLIDLVTALYFFNVFLYTIDDFKRDFPIYLRLLGLLMHGLVVLVLIEGKRRPSMRTGSKEILKKFLPFGLLLTYCLSYYVGRNKGLSMSGLLIFLVTTVPMIFYLLSLTFNIKHLDFLNDKRKIYNYGFMGLFLIVYAWTKFPK